MSLYQLTRLWPDHSWKTMLEGLEVVEPSWYVPDVFRTSNQRQDRRKVFASLEGFKPRGLPPECRTYNAIARLQRSTTRMLRPRHDDGRSDDRDPLATRASPLATEPHGIDPTVDEGEALTC